MLVRGLVSSNTNAFGANMPLSYLGLRRVKPCAKRQKLSDAGGLHLLVQPSGSKLWRLAYRFGGKQKLLSLVA